jgi:perosamine synthetase
MKAGERLIQIAKPLIGNEETTAVTEAMLSGQLASGKQVADFEAMFSEYLGVKYAVATCNGTTALHAALLAAGIGARDLVVTTPFSFIATSNGIVYTGAVPVFADIDEDSFNIDPREIELIARNRKVKAVVIVHLFGNPCDMERIEYICSKYGIALIEDCAQAHGAEYKGKKAGTFGRVSIFSFYPTKNMTTGEGGMIVTDDEEVYESSRKLINHGQSGRYNHVLLGYNFRMTDISAAIGIQQLKKLEGFNSRRISNAQRYMKEINNPLITLPKAEAGCKHVYNQFTVTCSERDRLMEHLASKEIGYGIYYPSTIPSQPLYRELGLQCSCEKAEKACKQVLSLPVHPALEKWEADKVIEAVNSFR